MKNTDKIFFYILLIVPFISSILSTIHIIDLVALGNVASMALAVAITFEIGSVVSFAATGGSIMKHVNKGWLYFVFGMLFILQSFGNVYSGVAYINDMLVVDPTWLDTLIEMSFGYFTLSEIKILISTLIGLPLPIISLVMLKFALDKASVDAFIDKTNNVNIVDSKSDNIQLDNNEPILNNDVDDNTVTNIDQDNIESSISDEINTSSGQNVVKEYEQPISDLKKK
jgi:hypothetical protein